MTFALLALGLACSGDETLATTGQAFERYFPLDGYRYWEFVSEDPFSLWTARIEKGFEPDSSGEWDIYAMTMTDADSGDLLRTVYWSADGDAGVLIHGYEVLAAGDGSTLQNKGSADFDPPLTFGPANMASGDAESTTTGGVNFTSTFAATEACPNTYTEVWESCRRIELTDDDTEGDLASPIAGTYWLAEDYGLAWYQTTGDAEPWKLSKAVVRDDDPNAPDSGDSR
jgi:hypothetical protein